MWCALYARRERKGWYPMAQQRLEQGLAFFASLTGGWFDRARADETMVDREDPRALRLFFVHRGVAVAELFILRAPLHDGEFVGQARIYDRNQRAQTRPIDDTQVGTDRARAGWDEWIVRVAPRRE